jgi:hypothetical protein
MITPTTSNKFGDYQCNSPMSLHKSLKESGAQDAPKAPRDVAMKIIECLPQNKLLSKCDVAGPGFINAYLNVDVLASMFADILKDGVKMPPCDQTNVVVDFSSPNIAKVCFFVRKCVCLYVCICMHVCMHIYTCLYLCMCVRISFDGVKMPPCDLSNVVVDFLSPNIAKVCFFVRECVCLCVCIRMYV